jgi:hypothetical protein
MFMQPGIDCKSYDELVELLAGLEHEQWVVWSRDIAKHEAISGDRLKRWAKLWVSYAKLPDAVKESDRQFARKVVGRLFVC